MGFLVEFSFHRNNAHVVDNGVSSTAAIPHACYNQVKITSNKFENIYLKKSSARLLTSVNEESGISVAFSKLIFPFIRKSKNS